MATKNEVTLYFKTPASAPAAAEKVEDEKSEPIPNHNGAIKDNPGLYKNKSKYCCF